MSYPSLTRALRVAILVAALPLLATACASSGARFSGLHDVPPNAVQLVVFRPDMFLDGGVSYQLDVNGQEVAILRNAGFVVVQAQPGAVLMELQAANLLNRLSFSKVSLPLSVEPNTRVFVRASPKLGTVIPAFAYVGRTRFLQVVPEAEAMREIQVLRQSE